MLAQNRLAALLFGAAVDIGAGPEDGLVHRWFTDPAGRQVLPEIEHDEHGRTLVVELNVLHPSVGAVALKRRSLWVDGRERLLWFTPTPGSDAAQKLDLLAVVGLHEFGRQPPPETARGGSASPGPGPRTGEH